VEIKLDASTRATIIEQAKEQAVTAIVSELDFKQIAAEIRNRAIKEVAGLISDKVMTEPRVQEAIHRAVQSVESRINHKIHAALKDGLVVRFPGLTDDPN